MEMRRSGDGHRLHAQFQQRVEIVDRGAAQRAGDEIALRGIGIGDADELNSGKSGEHAGMVGPHGADADHANAQRRIAFHGPYHVAKSAPDGLVLRPGQSPSTLRVDLATATCQGRKHFLIQSITAISAVRCWLFEL